MHITMYPVMIFFLTISLLLPTNLASNPDSAKIGKDAKEIHSRLGKIYERFEEINKYNDKDELKDVSPVDVIQLFALRRRIATVVRHLQRTIDHSVKSAVLIHHRALESGERFLNKTRERLYAEKDRILRQIETQYGPLDTTRGIIACLGAVVSEVELSILKGIREISCCIDQIIEVLEKTIEALFCQLITALETLDDTLSTLSQCNKISNISNVVYCLDTIIVGVEGTVASMVNDVMALLVDIGRLFSGLLSSIASCVNPIVDTILVSQSNIVGTLTACVTSILGRPSLPYPPHPYSDDSSAPVPLR